MSEMGGKKSRWGDIHVKRDDHVATVEIRKPPHNSVSVDLMRDLADALEFLDGEPDTRAIILKSEGKSFCAGADLTGRAEEVGLTAPTTNPLYDQAVRLYSTKTPIVAAIHGAAVGAGVGLALVADFRIATPEARFAVNFTKLGFHPGFGLTHTLPRLVGKQNAAMMFLTSRRLKAEEAMAIGLVDVVVEPGELNRAAKQLAEEIAENAPLAIKSTRATLRQGLAEAVREATNHEFKEQQWLMKTEDFKEGVKSVNERRAGKFKGK